MRLLKLGLAVAALCFGQDFQVGSKVRDFTLSDLKGAALEAVLAGKDVQDRETKAFGCTIKRVRRTT